MWKLLAWHHNEKDGDDAVEKLLGDELVVSNQKFLNSSGDIDWEKFAPNGGYVPGSKISGQTLETGTIIDRCGNQYGRYTSSVGGPYEQRVLLYIENPNAYHQYELPANIKQLIKDEF